MNKNSKTNPPNGEIMTEQMLTILEVAHYLHVHPSTVRRWEKEGRLKTYRIGQKGMLRFHKEDILQFVSSGIKGK